MAAKTNMVYFIFLTLDWIRSLLYRIRQNCSCSAGPKLPPKNFAYLA